MNPEQQKSILAIALFAAFTDGAKHEREREDIRRIADSLATDAGAPDLARLYQDVLLKRFSLEAAAAALRDPGERQLAYEMAVCVCDADGRQSEVERRFLAELKALLKLDDGQVEAFEREADAIVELSEKVVPALAAAGDQCDIKEFIAAAGVGLTSQYLEQFGRKLLGGLLGPAKQLQAQYLPQIQQKASTLDAGQIMAMVRGA